MADVSRMNFEQRLSAMLERTAGKVGPDIAAQLRALIDPKSLSVVAGVLVLWVVSHGFAIGEIIDTIVAAVGVFSIGLAVFSGIDEVFEFARDTYNATSDPDLDASADHLAKAIAILGITAVLAVLFRGRPSTRRANPGPPPHKHRAYAIARQRAWQASLQEVAKLTGGEIYKSRPMEARRTRRSRYITSKCISFWCRSSIFCGMPALKCVQAATPILRYTDIWRRRWQRLSLRSAQKAGRSFFPQSRFRRRTVTFIG